MSVRNARNMCSFTRVSGLRAPLCNLTFTAPALFKGLSKIARSACITIRKFEVDIAHRVPLKDRYSDQAALAKKMLQHT